MSSQAEKNKADVRMARVMRIPKHFSRKIGVFDKTGSLKSADWLHFLTTGIFYVLKPLLTGQAKKSFTALVRALRLVPRIERYE